MSRWIRFASVAMLAAAVVACGANGGDPVARQQLPAGPAASDSGSDQGGSGGMDSGGSGSDGSDQGGSGDGGSDGSDQGGSGGGGGSGSVKHGRNVGLPESIRITEISPQDFENSIATACGSKDGAPGCLTVRYEIITDPDRACGLTWSSDPPAVPTDEGGVSTVQRGSHISATIVTCPDPDETTSPAAEDTMSPAPEDDEMSTSDSPTASP
ncbi:MAG TPA: hypothetical protein VH573_18785 [Mycobacteriales bacterium]|jgi:hypothetical protein